MEENKMKKVDLHTHSYFSDGTLSPTELVCTAKKANIDVLALTDHDTVAGVLEAEDASKKVGIQLIRGIEISAFDEDCHSIHVLGLKLQDLESLKELEQKNKEDRMKRNLYILNGYNHKYNQNINIQDVQKQFNGTIGSGNLSQYLFNKGFVESYKKGNELLNEFRGVRYGVHISEAIKVIHDAGGKAFLAHPYSLKKDDETLFGKISDFKTMGLDGIECFHSNHTEKQKELYLNFAQKFSLLISGGSDFHGAYKPDVNLGYGKSKNLLVDSSRIIWI